MTEYRAWFSGDLETGQPLMFRQYTDEDGLLRFIMVEDPYLSYQFSWVFGDEEWIKEPACGLLDRENNPIFSGDILCYEDEYYQVGFSKGAFGWYDSRHRFTAFACEPLHEACTVAGNIHQNPYLLPHGIYTLPQTGKKAKGKSKKDKTAQL